MNVRNPKVSVLMPVFNGEEYLQESIESILNQTFSDFEFLIISEHGTSDESLAIIQSYSDERIRHVHNTTRLGLVGSLNLGIKEAKGGYIARMDADDISLPDRLLEEVIFLDNNPDIAMVGTAREVIDEFGVKIMNIIPKKDPTFQDICNNNPFQHSSVMIHKSILLEFGGYNEQFPSCEDYALWLLIVKKYKVYNIPKILCKLRMHKERVSVKKFEEQALSGILAIRMATNQLTDNDMKGIHLFGVKYLKDKLCKDEKIYYLNRLAAFHRINENFREARKIYLKIFFMNPADLIAIINYFRLFLGKWFVSETTKIYNILKTNLRYTRNP